MAIATPVQAGDAVTGSVDVTLEVRGPNALDVLNGLTLELFDESTGQDVASNCTAPKLGGPEPLRMSYDVGCTGLAEATHTFGLLGVPEGWDAYVTDCGPLVQQPPPERITTGDASFTVSAQEPMWECTIVVGTSVVAIDKIVTGDGDHVRRLRVGALRRRGCTDRHGRRDRRPVGRRVRRHPERLCARRGDSWRLHAR
ncbi:MAG: hypothetical protein R2697_10345 [Ilumatobacteraceae bacterium]